jgi:hypothetical protein
VTSINKKQCGRCCFRMAEMKKTKHKDCTGQSKDGEEQQEENIDPGREWAAMN